MAVTRALLDTLEVDLPRDLHSIQTHGSGKYIFIFKIYLLFFIFIFILFVL